MPVEVEFTVAVERPDRVTYRDVHWLISTWLDRGHGGGNSDSAPAHQGEKTYTLRDIRPGNGIVSIRMGLLDDRAPVLDAERLLQLEQELARSEEVVLRVPDRLSLSDDLSLGIVTCLSQGGKDSVLGSSRNGQPFRTVKYARSDRDELFSVIRYDAWEDLVAGVSRSDWRMTFHRPTSFRSDNAYLPFPSPDRLLSGLCRVWNRTAPHPLRNSCAEQRTCEHQKILRVLDFDISKVKQPGFLGFRGVVDLGFRTDRTEITDAVQREAACLLRFSEYAGIGYGAARGFGSVTVEALPLR